MSIPISIIIPVYNVENYIELNIKSLLNQNIELEIIYVDDGSRDKSVEIIESYIEKDTGDKTIRLFRKENGGPGSARNYGIRECRGEFIVFIDGDDFLTENVLGEIFNTLIKKNADILIWKSKKFKEFDGQLKEVEHNREVEEQRLVSRQTYFENNLHPSDACHVYKKSLVLNNHLFFSEDYNFSEDLEFVLKCSYYAKNILIFNLPVYNRIVRSESLSHIKSINKCYSSLKMGKSLKLFVENYVDNGDILKYYIREVDRAYSNSIHLAIAQGIPLKELFSDEKFKEEVLEHLKRSPRTTMGMAYRILKKDKYFLYEKLYLMRNWFLGI